MKKNGIDWLNYWNDQDDLNTLKEMRDNIDSVYEDIRQKIGRMLMSEEMLELQESLEERIDKLTEEQKKKDKIAA
jgi:hypothetical protein